MGDKDFDIGLPEKLGKKLSKDFLLNEEFFEFFDDFLIEKCFLKIIVLIEKKQSFWGLDIQVDGFCNTFCDRCGDSLKISIFGTDQYYLKRQERNKNAQTENVIFLSSKKKDFNIKSVLQEACFFLFPITRKHDSQDCNQEVLNKLEESNRKAKGQVVSSKGLKELKDKLKK